MTAGTLRKFAVLVVVVPALLVLTALCRYLVNDWHAQMVLISELLVTGVLRVLDVEGRLQLRADAFLHRRLWRLVRR